MSVDLRVKGRIEKTDTRINIVFISKRLRTYSL